jgi:hypothetical protein
MCHKCDGFTDKISIDTPGRFHDLTSEIRQVVDEGTMTLIQGTCSLKDIDRDKPWPADILQHDFRCTSCGRMFRLFVDTYHGRGTWQTLA